MKKDSKIYVAGHRGVAGTALCELLSEKGYSNVVIKSRSELELTDFTQVQNFFEYERPEYVFLLAGKAGGIKDKIEHPVEFFEQNIRLQVNIMSCAQKIGVKKLLFMGSVYAYPSNAPQPIKEESLLTGSIGSPQDEPYALAKIAGVKMCNAYRQQYGCNFFSVMPCVFFGKGSSFDLTRASVIPSMMRRMYQAKVEKQPEFEIWGSGKPVREFLSGKDVARACLFLMENYDNGGYLNLGNGGIEVSISEAAEVVKKVIGYQGKLVFNTQKPDGMMRKAMDSSKLLSLGWHPEDAFKQSVEDLYSYFLEKVDELL